MRNQLPAPRAEHSPRSAATSRWRPRAVAWATALLLASAVGDANALALGRISVKSALGEPLRAEIDVPQISADEIATLRPQLASPAEFRAAGVEFSPILSTAQISLQRRTDGSYYLQLSSPRAVNEPFLDLLIQAQWASGRITRDVSLLFDPPKIAHPPVPLIAAQVPPAASPAPRPAAATPPIAASAPAAPARASAVTAQAVPALRRPAPGAGRPAAAPRLPATREQAPQGTERVQVRPGDTAGRLASRYRPATVSLDQMLVAMLRSNPEAFFDSNMNRLKAGSVLQVPSAEQAAEVTAAEAHEIVVAQSRDFNEFRRRLAEGVAAAPRQGAASRASAGHLQTQVEEKSPTSTAPDRLTLSKGTVQGRSTGGDETEARIAREHAARDEAARLAELDKNIADLKRLTAAASATPAPAGAAPAAGAVPLAIPGASPSAAPIATATPTAPAPAAAPVKPAASASAAAAKPMPKPAPAPADAGWLEWVNGDPLLPAAAGGLLAVLAGLALLRLRRGRKSAQVDSSFLESRLQPDSFFGASGGQRIDTAEGPVGPGSSMVYSPSQLDAAGDVDPVAEADVYLAYGRDLQAEEILKEALRITPQRVAIHGKLLEIHAKRRDLQAFELAAAEAHALTRGAGPEWRHISAMGRELDPSNPLYHDDGGLPIPAPAPRAADPAGERGTEPYLPDDEADVAVALDPDPAPTVALDLDLDFLQQQAAGDSAPAPLAAAPADDAPDLSEAEPLAQGLAFDLDFDLGARSPAVAASSAALEVADASLPVTLPEPHSEQISAPVPEAHTKPISKPISELAADPIAEPLSAAAPEPVAEAASEPLAFTLVQPAPAGEFDAPELLMDAPTTAAEPRADAETATDPVPALAESVALDLPNLDLDLPSHALAWEPEPEPQARAHPPAAAAPAARPADLMDLDLGALSLDLAPSSLAALEDPDAEGAEADPLATKLALAEEFKSFGDADGARSLAEEVLAEATGELRQRAEQFLADIA